MNYTEMPDEKAGGSPHGRGALEVAICDLKEGAGEVGGNNTGEYVRKVLGDLQYNALSANDRSWCAAAVSSWYQRSKLGIPFHYDVHAKSLMNQMRRLGWFKWSAGKPDPQPGDMVFWWRDTPRGSSAHVGLVYVVDGVTLHTIEGNRTDKVQGFSYNLARQDRLLGFARVPAIH